MITVSLAIVLLIFAGYTINFSREVRINREIEPSYATIYLGMYPEILNVSNLYVLAFLARRTIYAVVMILLTSRPAGQVFILIASSVAMGGLIGSEKPYFFKHNQRLQMFNECAIFVCCGILMCFTQNINQAMIDTTIEDRKYIGYILCLVTFIVIVVNLAALVSSLTWQVGFRIRRKANLAKRATAS